MRQEEKTAPATVTQNLEGKTIIVTGAASGIGRESALLFAQAGAKVIVSDIAADGARATVDAIRSLGGVASFEAANLAVEEDVQALVQAAVTTYGRLDGAFNNAGIGQAGKLLHELSTEEWQRALLIDLTSVFWCIKYQVIAMMSTGGGAIVNTASSLGQVAIPNASEYVAAKHGVIGLTRAAAADYGAKGVRVNSVLPGIVNTPLVQELVGDPRFATFLEKLKDRHPIGRFGEPNEIGEAARWLLSDAASFVNGASIAVDGGYLAI
ncbi:2,5-dichloro-2,5-cyclohexadiene-1,4-diol dehydrogenase [compost metagenome]|jgi:NAD(P)-dependent dehydrogenase (short-subunit alcohol dehydrogenase family)|uniref:SDR family NAD(P)-dependent oxidoreductase n=1 Tax=Pseudomonas fluorescens TaxID=294 RepID=UPI000FB262B1|nr:glucose 1-dehydrogenase [Pseudomonas fluorescens]VVM82572.1 2,5-dichloro-2,5-cyclohexadiene-1,4-diol dehydrogenase [Pseudomonas fluorescens]